MEWSVFNITRIEVFYLGKKKLYSILGESWDLEI